MVPKSPMEQPIRHHPVLKEAIFHVCLQRHDMFNLPKIANILLPSSVSLKVKKQVIIVGACFVLNNYEQTPTKNSLKDTPVYRQLYER